jgi:hypothetical protein
MSLPLPPNSCLHSILLVTSSRSLGPRLVFHYPPLSPSAAALAANKAPAWFGNETSTASIDSHSSDTDWDSSTENEGEDNDIDVGSRTSGGRGSGRTGSRRDYERHKGGSGSWRGQENIDEEDKGLDGGGDGNSGGDARGMGGDYDWTTVLGFKVDALEKILCPSKAFNKRRFELGVEGIVFVGAPMFVRDDGLWKKGRRKKDKHPPEKNLDDGDLLSKLRSHELKDNDNARDMADESTKPEVIVYPPGYEPGYGHGVFSGTTSKVASVTPSEAGSDARSTSTTDTAPDMTMFNIVFVLNPPALEYQLRVKEMYDNVTRKYAKALKYEQARFQYIWKESNKIINIKQRAKENGKYLSLSMILEGKLTLPTGNPLTITWREIIETSPLAKSIAILFDAISNNKIAHIHFDATFNTSFQIPQPDSTPYLPSAMEPQMPGLWLTTSNVVIEDVNDTPMTQHAALLLLEEPETLVKELEGGAKGDAGPLAFYIRNIIPTKSLQKISIKHNILAQDMEYIASHLVYWRRARLIAPLHPRDTYIVSPNADMSALQAAIPAYAARFPTLPSLPKMLNMLSGQPRQYRTFIPTNEHRDAFMDILAWLMRGGWVTQLRTFAWVRVTPEIKAQVAQDMLREAQMKKAADEARRDADAESLAGSQFSDKRSSLLAAAARPSTPMRRLGRRDEEEGYGLALDSVLSPRSAYRGSPARPASDTGSTSSVRTTIALSSTAARPNSPLYQVKPHRPSPLHLKATSPTPSSRPVSTFSPTSPTFPTSQQPQPTSPPPSPNDFKSSLILSPQKAGALEARWLEKIGQGFEDADLREHWPMLLRHLDGKHALEDMSPREGIKRKRVAALVAGVRSWLVVVRHW